MKIYNNKQKNFCQIVPSDFFKKYADIGTREQKESAYFNIEIAENSRTKRNCRQNVWNVYF